MVQAYDLFKHNCNNFTDSFSNFLLGKGIPGHITSMPEDVLKSPLGQMFLPHLTNGMNGGRQNGLQQSSQAGQAQAEAASKTHVHSAGNSSELLRLLDTAKDTSAIVFFTSATCGPCKMVMPFFEELAREFEGRVLMVTVDIASPQAQAIAAQYEVRATPTFITFLRGEKENVWQGADPATLRGNVQLLTQMADPSHPHRSLKLPNFHSLEVKPVLYTKTPPLDKLLAKMGEDVASKTEVQDLKAYITVREAQGAIDAVLPNLAHTAQFVRDAIKTLPQELLFAVVDLFRCALADTRFSAYFAEERDHETICAVIDFVNNASNCPYALRLVTLQMACNLFSTPLFSHEILGNSKLRSSTTQLISSSFLDESHNNVRVATSSLLFNLALADRHAKTNKGAARLPESDQVELAASVVEAIDQESKSSDALRGMLLAFGHLFYGADLDGELADLLRALDAQGTILRKKGAFPDEKLVNEVGNELLGKGLAKP